MNRSLDRVGVRDYMSAPLLTFSPNTEVITAISALLDAGVSAAPVVDRLGNLIGMLSEKDCLKIALDAGYHGDSGGRVADFMSKTVETVDADASILTVAKMFLQSPFRRYPVMSDNRLVGSICRADVLRAIDQLRGNGPI